jgi:hypothetical protein
MSIRKKNNGLIIFGAILIIAVIASLAAYQMSGHMSIEDRYTAAVGLPLSEEDEGGGTFSGFSVEGNPVLYAIVLGVLVIGCYAAYRKFRF